MFTQKGKFISIAAVVVGAILIGYGAIVYLFVFPKNSNGQNAAQEAAAPSINPSKIRMDVQKGSVTTDKKMILILKMSGFETSDSAAEAQKDGNLQLEVAGKSAMIRKSEIVGEKDISVEVQSDVAEDVFSGFNAGRLQNLDVRADISYGQGSTATKSLSAAYKKSDRKNSSGEQEISFSSVATETMAANTKPVNANVNTQAVKPKVKKPIELPAPVSRRGDAIGDDDESVGPRRVYNTNTNVNAPRKVDKTGELLREKGIVNN